MLGHLGRYSVEISVVMPCYNAGAYIQEAVNSVLAQSGSFTVAKIAIVDDGSTDPATISALAQLAKRPRIEIIRHGNNRGPGAARNAGVRHTESEWLCFLDADDILTERSLDVRAAASRSFPDCGWIGGDFALWLANGSIEESFFQSRPRPFAYLKSAFEAKTPQKLNRPVSAFIDTALTHTCAALYKRDLFMALGGFDESLMMQQDYNFFLRASTRSDFVFVPEIVMLYRQHSQNLTRDPVLVNHWRALALRKLIPSNEFAPYRRQIREKVSRIYQDSAYLLRDATKFSEARGAAISSLRYAPGNLGSWKSLLASLALR